jgi:hypothetical protein
MCLWQVAGLGPTGDHGRLATAPSTATPRIEAAYRSEEVYNISEIKEGKRTPINTPLPVTTKGLPSGFIAMITPPFLA